MAEALDLSGLTPVDEQPPELDVSGLVPIPATATPAKPEAVKDTGLLGAIPAGLVHAGKGIQQTGEALTGGRPQVEQPEILAAQPTEWKDFLNPRVLAQKTLYGLAESAPTMATAIFGGVLGSMAGGGPETPIGWATALGGTALGAALGSTLQSLGGNLGQALQETKDPEEAWKIALQRTGIGAAGSAAGFSAFSFAPFSNAVKKTLFDALGIAPATRVAGERAVARAAAEGAVTADQQVAMRAAEAATPMARVKDIALQAGIAQPSVAVLEHMALNLQQGKPPLEGVSSALPGAIVGTAAPMLAHEVARRLQDRRAGVEPEQKPAAEAPIPPADTTPVPVVTGEPQGPPRPFGPEDFARDRAAHAIARNEQLGEADRAAHEQAYTQMANEELQAWQARRAQRQAEAAGPPVEREATQQREDLAAAGTAAVPEVPALAQAQQRAAAEVAGDQGGKPADTPTPRPRPEPPPPQTPEPSPEPPTPPPPAPAAPEPVQTPQPAPVAAPPPAPEPAQLAPIPYNPVPNGNSNAFTYRGEAVPVEYGIADARHLISSNNDDLSPNPAFPQNLQPRDRSRTETELQIQNLLNPQRFQPEMLGPAPDAGSGTPIIGPEGVVEGGNARTIALRRAYAQNLPVAQAYRQWLSEQGYPIQGVDQPVLVRINRAGMDMAQREVFARDMNIPPQAAMSPSEQAMADARQVTGDALSLYQGGDITSAANRPFLRSLLRGIVPENQYGAFIAPDGGLTRPGLRRIEAALLARAYSDPGIVSKLVEDADTNIRQIGSAMLGAAPAWAQMRTLVADGRAPQPFDITEHLLGAVRLIDHAREQNRNVAEFVQQSDMFGGGIPAETQGVLHWMVGGLDFTRRFSKSKIEAALTDYAESVQLIARGSLERPAVDQLIEGARERAQGASGDLFDQAVGAPGGAGPVRTGADQNRPEVQGPRPGAAGVEPPANRPPEEGGGPGAATAAGPAEGVTPPAPVAEAPTVPVLEAWHTKKGIPVFVVERPRNYDDATYADIKKQMTALGGYWSGYNKQGAIPGFQFDNNRAAAEQFARILGAHEAGNAGPNPLEMAQRFAQAFASGQTFPSILAARKFAADTLGVLQSTPGARKMLDEAIEHGVVLRARDIVAESRANGATPEQVYDRLVDLYRRQPLLNERDSDSLRRQAYSTPAPIAYLASRLAGIEPGKTVYEPTAGNGMLLIEADPHSTLANEIDPSRRAALAATFPNVTGSDAAFNRPESPTPADIVIANPPFGKLRDDLGNETRWHTPDYITKEIDHAVVFKALEELSDDGRAVLIVGSKPEIGAQGADRRRQFYNSNENRAFFKSLYDRYNVVDHFTISGDLYNRQGAAWPIDMIVIEGRGKSERPLPGVTPPRIYNTFDELRGKLDEVAGTQRPVGTTEQQPGNNGGVGPTGRPELGTILGPDVGPGGENGGGGRGGEGPQPAGGGVAAGDVGVPEQPAGPVGARPGEAPVGPGGGRPGEQPAAEQLPGSGEGSAAGSATGAGENQPGELAGPRDTERTGPLSDDELSGLLDDLIGGEPAKPESATTPGTPREYATPEAGWRPGMRPEMVWEPGEPPAKPESAPPRSPRDGPRPGGNETTRATSTGAGEGLDSLASLFESEPYRREYVPGVDPDYYDKALPAFVKSVTDVGGKAGDNIRETAAKIVGALTNSGMTPDRLAKMKPYLLQFIKDVQDGVVQLAKPNEEVETQYQVRYNPASKANPVGTLVPVNMQAPIERALSDLQSRVGDLDEFVGNKLGYNGEELNRAFSAEQVDAVALAIDNLDRGAGFIIGDQTGVGKGRVVAAMIRYGIRQNLVPIFMTKSPGLYADMYRDIRDVGMKDFNALVTNADLTGKKRVPISEDEFLSSLPETQLDAALRAITETGRLPAGYDALFTNYSQIQTVKGAKTPRHAALEALAPNSLIIMDESHEAGGGDARPKIDPDTGQVIPTRSMIARELLANANGAIYSSATYAKNPQVMTLYFKTDMPMAVDGDVSKLSALIQSGGVPLQQFTANMLTEGGQYTRRERSFDGVNFAMDTVASDRATGENSSDLLRRTFQFDQQMERVREAFSEGLAGEGEVTAADGAIGNLSAEGVGFAQIMHNVVGQALLAIKADEAANRAIEAHQRGEKPVVALSSTFGALLNDYVADQGLRPGADLSGLTFNRAFQNYLERTRQVTIKHPFDRRLNRKYYITDSDMQALGFRDMVTEFDGLKNLVGETDLGVMPASPLDHVIDKMRAAGMRVGEITGRGLVVQDGILTQRDNSEAAKKRTMNAFNAGELDALLINRSGSTGYSLHASQAYRDQKPRHMILLQPDPNIDTFMQMLGRIHRTGQVELPIYSLLVSDQPAEKRLAANLMRKLGSLNANTSANKKSAVGLGDNVVDMFNRYGDEVVGSVLHDEADIANMLDLHPNDEGEWRENIASRATGRLVLLPTAEQERIWSRIEQEYRDYIETLDRTGQNALEAKTLDLDARTIESRPISEAKDTSSPFGRSAVLETVDTKKLGKPFTMDQVRERIAKTVGTDDTPGRGAVNEFVNKLTRDLDEKTGPYRDQLAADLEVAQREMLELRAEVAAQVAAQPKPDAGSGRPRLSPLEIKLDKAEKKAHRISDQGTVVDRNQQFVRDFVESNRPGTAIELEVGNGEAAEKFFGVVIGVTPNGRTTNPAALSGWIAHIAIDDAGREVRVPLSQFAGRPSGGTYEPGNARITAADAEVVRHSFEQGESVSREQRYIVTGNLLAGYDKFSGRGQFIMFRRADGDIVPGIMLPRKMDPNAELNKLPVPLTVDQAFEFIDRVNKETGRSGLIHTPDSLMRMQRIEGTNDYLLSATKTGGNQYWGPKAVEQLLGANKFSGGRGAKTLQARADRATAERVLNWYVDNFDTKFEAREDKPHAIAVSGRPDPGSLAETTPYGSKPRANEHQQDYFADYNTFADASPSGDHHQIARDWTTSRGRDTGYEHMAVWDPTDEKVTHAVSSGLVNEVKMPADVIERASNDPYAGLVLHHNHPEGRALSSIDVIEGLAYPGIDRIVAHGHNDTFSSARLSPNLQDFLAGRSYEERKAFLKWAVMKADVVVAEKLFPLIRRYESNRQSEGLAISRTEAKAIHADLVNRALETAGIMDYVSSRDSVAPVGETFAKHVIREAAQRVGMALGKENLGHLFTDERNFNEQLNRSTRTVQPEVGTRSLSGADEAPAAGRLGEDRDRSGRGLSETGEEVPGAGGKGTLKEEAPYSNAAAERDLHPVMKRGEPPTLAGRVKGWWDGLKEDRALRFKQYALDSTAALEAAERGVSGGKLAAGALSATIRARLARNSPHVAAYVIGKRGLTGGFEGGMVRWNAEKGIVEPIEGAKSLTQILGPLWDNGLDSMWAAWKIAVRADRLAQEGREHNVSEEFIQKWADLPNKVSPEQAAVLRQVDEAWRGYNKQLLDFAQDTGLINADSRAIWEKHGDYVPFYRALEDDITKGPGVGGRSIANIRSPIKTLKGGEARVADLYDNMMRNTASIVDRGMRNTAMKAAVDLLHDTGVLTSLSKVARIDLTGAEGRARLEAMGLDPDTADARSKEAAQNLWGMLKNKDPNVVSVMVDGKPQFYQVENPLLLRSLISIGPHQVDGVMKLFSGARMLVTRGVTLDPAYMFANLARDSVATWALGYDVTPGISTAKGLVSSLRGSPSVMALVAGGAMGQDRYRPLPGQMRKAMEDRGITVLNSPKKLLKAIEKLTEVSEQANRVAAYDADIANGMAPAEALARAQDVLNFSMRGDGALINFFLDTVPFLNSRIQGLYRLARGAQENPKTMLLRGAMLTGLALALWSINKDNPEYQKLEEYDKQYASHFWIGGQHFALPNPFEVGAIFMTLPEMLMNYANNGRDKQLVSAFTQMVKNQLNLDPTPALVRPALDLYGNRDSFTGRPIVTDLENRGSATLQYGPRTSSTAIGIGQLTGQAGLGAEQVEHLIRGYGGAVGAYVLAASDALASSTGIARERADLRTSQYPVISRFYRGSEDEPSFRNRWMTEFYDLRGEVSKLHTDFNKLKGEDPKAAVDLARENATKLALNTSLEAMAKQLSQVRKAQTQIGMNPNLSSAEKREKQDVLIAAQNRIVERVRPLIRVAEGLPTTP